MISVLPFLKKTDGAGAEEEALYAGAHHVLDALDATRSCFLLAELTNNAFAAHDEEPERLLLDFIAAVFDVLR